ncbi:hypothetical protein ACP70R_004929 [Stipagrostis hirtigluma subsp. patula]
MSLPNPTSVEAAMTTSPRQPYKRVPDRSASDDKLSIGSDVDSLAHTSPWAMADLPLYLLFLPLLIVLPFLYFHRSTRAHAAGSRLPPSPWALPVIGHIHHLAGALPHRAMRDLARRHGPLMLLRLGELPAVVASSADAAREVMRTHDLAFATRPISPTARILLAPPDLFPSSRLAMLVSPTPRLMKRERQNMMAFIDTIIQEHQDNRCAGAGAADDEDLLDVLLRIQREGELDPPLTTDNIKSVIIDIFGGSSETSATTLQWIMAELMRNPRVMRKAQDEVRRVLDGQEAVTEESLGDLHYLRLVVKEALRLHPPAPLLIPRECRSPCRVLGFDVPAGAMVLVNAWAIATDPAHWDAPEEFAPERFEGGGVDFKGTDFEYIPFGARRRMCPGIAFGLANMDLALACLLYHFDWKLPDGMEPGELDMAETMGITTRRRSDLLLVATVHVPLAGA